MSKIDSDVDYFFFLRAFVFFAVFLVAAFVFLFFAIAALLIWWMATSVQCSRESTCTIHPITTAGKK